tara:strand:- start:202 stop:879 length:678 start_codon:yes stop_codon:yes gene_type:complete
MKKNIILTGDSKGLGLNIRQRLEKKYNVIGLSRTSKDIRFDLSNTEKIKNLYHNDIKKFSPIYGLINNAAIAYDDLATNMNLDSLKRMYEVNVFSTFMLTKYIIRDMLLNKTQGSIVHISSISAHTGYKGLSMYASTKGALEAYSKNISREWGRLGIRSNVVCPGFMMTDMSSSITGPQKDKIFKRNSYMSELRVSDVAKTIEFLVSKDSNGITGQVIHVDNGTL